ncbi:fimbrial protein [Metapseudomonas otitidis]|uniref:fimbrial protein n=1 Tax=Metapseudomonas otitidis TaxID=319939 RepID=UPI0013F68F32|nr:fimbrial protein [Pseudomonas otitidis]
MSTKLCITFVHAFALLLAPSLVMGASCTGSGLKTAHTLPATLTVPRDAPIGTVLYDTGGWIGNGQASARCRGWGSFWLSQGYANNMASTSLKHVYESGVPGIGIKVAWYNNAKHTPGSMNAGAFMTSPRSNIEIARDDYVPAQRWWIQLIKTGPMASGTFRISPIRIYYHDLLTNELEFSASQLVFQKQGCRLLDANMEVHLAKANLRDFSGPGSTARPHTFQIPLECDPELRVSYSLDAPLKASPSVVKNSDTRATARGVGMQLLREPGGMPVVFGEKVFHALLPSGQEAFVNIPLTARYYQYDTRLVPGTVEALVQLTLYYE